MLIGFIGTGTISAAMIEGLTRHAPAPSIVVSPRSESLTRALTEKHQTVRRAASNAEVAAVADIVVLGMRPAQLTDALAGVTFRAEQIVVSLVAGLSLADVGALAPHSRVARAVPMPGIARREGPITVYPDLNEVTTMLAPLGDLIVARSEAELNMGGLSGFMSSYFELQAHLIQRAMASGVGEAEARRYVVSLLGMLAATARQTPATDFAQLVTEHQTKGGLNERVRQRLLERGWFAEPAEAFEAVGKLDWTALG